MLASGSEFQSSQFLNAPKEQITKEASKRFKEAIEVYEQTIKNIEEKSGSILTQISSDAFTMPVEQFMMTFASLCLK
jgi:putative heme iron utilization protein